jgi:putative ABC transport system permease protein
MFIAIRDLKFAKGRFSLLAGVIALMTFMVVMLGGLTAGLGAASISAIDKLPVDAIAFPQPASGQGVSFSTSSLPATAATRLSAEAGVRAAQPIGVATTQLHTTSSTVAVTLIGTDPSLFPDRQSGHLPAADEIAVTANLADDQHLRVGDRVEVAGRSLRIASIVADTSFNHLSAVYTGISTWQQVTHNNTITAVGLRLDGASPTALDRAANVHVVSKTAAFDAVGAYSSEQGSLNLMRGLLVAVSLLIVEPATSPWSAPSAAAAATCCATHWVRR